MSTPVIEIKDLWFSYNGVPILKNVNFTVEQDDFVAVIGPNGGGKTTLVKLMLGLLGADRGSIRVFGLSPEKAAPRVGYVPQEMGVSVGLPVSVQSVVLMGRMRPGGGWRKFSKPDRTAAQAALERVSMWDLRQRRINELSGGQKQRVYLARALVSEPKLLIFDEPTSSVDSRGQTDFYDFLKELNKSATIVVVSHDLMVLSTYVKSVACVSQQVHFHNRP
ncbi:MAG: ABC transporter ATP-binding protein, partial [Pseudomonadota bacterium]